MVYKCHSSNTGGPSPSHKSVPSPAHAAPLPPTRAPSTTVKTTQALPHAHKKGKVDQAKRKVATLPRPKSSGSAAGLDMKEILMKARSRSDRDRAFEELEQKKQKQDDDEDKPAAPWLNQLRKTTVTKSKEEEVSSPPQWVKRISQTEISVPNSNSDVPEFIKRVRTLSHHEADDSTANKPSSPVLSQRSPPPVGAKPSVKPPPAVKPRAPKPAGFHPKVPQGTEVAEKAPWLKQRERQINMSKEDVSGERDDDRPPSPTSKPPTTSKPPPALPSKPSESNASPISARKPPRPVPLPKRTQHEPCDEETNDKPTSDSPPELPKILRREIKPPPIPISQPAPVPSTSVPTHLAQTGLNPSPKPRLPSKAPPPIPRSTAEVAPAPVPLRNGALPPGPKPPPPFTPPPPFSESEVPLPPRTVSPAQLPVQTQGEPTPILGSVLKYRRLPLRSVDPFNPPPRPSSLTKPQGE